MKIRITIVLVLLFSLVAVAATQGQHSLPNVASPVAIHTGIRPLRFPFFVAPGATNADIVIAVSQVRAGDPCTCGIAPTDGTPQMPGAIAINCHANATEEVQLTITNHTAETLAVGPAVITAVCFGIPGE